MIKECNIQELKLKIDSKESFQFIDCRELGEWNEAHIEGTNLIPLSEFEQKFSEILKDKNAQIIIHCRSGKRSMNACMFLLSKGFTDLTNVENGIIGWIQAGHPVISE